MEYFLIIILQLLGVGFHVVQQVSDIDNRHPEVNRSEVFAIFFKNDWDTLMGSALVLALHVVTHYIIENYAPEVRSMKNYILYSFGLALVMGYGGQKIVYKYLGSAEKFLDDKIDNKLK